MAKIQLSSNVKLEITDGETVTHTFNVTYKEPSRKQRKEVEGSNKEAYTNFTELQKLDDILNSLKAELKVYTRQKNDDGILKASKAIQKTSKERDAVNKEFEAQGGFEKIFTDSKDNFLLCVGGKDKDDLIEFIDEYSDYADILKVIAEDAREQRGKKQS